MELLPREFFDRPSTEVAPDLLGCVLWHDSPEGLVAVRLVEVEAYQGSHDPASHAYRGQTARNAVMFGPPGHMYVYFTYGMHFCTNLVCQPPGQAEAVLLRAGEVVAGSELAAQRRGSENGKKLSAPAATNGSERRRESSDGEHGDGEPANGRPSNSRPGNGRMLRAVDLARGPARLCQALDIDRRLDGADVCEPGSPMGIGPAWSTDRGPAVISTGPRVGIRQATDRPWRYWLAGDGHVSIYRPLKPRAPRPKPVTGSGAEDGTMHR